MMGMWERKTNKQAQLSLSLSLSFPFSGEEFLVCGSVFVLVLVSRNIEARKKTKTRKNPPFFLL